VTSSGIHTSDHRGRRASLASALVLTAAAVLVAVGASPASAHDQLIGTDPGASSTVAVLPDEITLTFNDVVIDDGDANQVKVTDASGAALTDGAPEVQDNVVTQKLKAGGDVSGVVTVLWRVVSRDGHPVSDRFTFTVTGSAAPTTPAPTGSATQSSPSTPSASVVTTSPTAGGPASGGGSSPTPWIILGALTIAAIAATAYLVVARGRRPEPPSDPAPTESGDDSER
jgi:copper resistance protein C